MKILDNFKSLKKEQKVCFILEAVLGLLSIVVGILFIVRVQWLYSTYKDVMDHPYTPETIWKAFAPIMAIVIIWGITLVAAGVLSYIFPHEQRFRYKTSNVDTVKELEKKLPYPPVEGCEQEYSIIENEKKNRLIANIVVISVSVISSIFAYSYLLNAKNFQATNTEGFIMEIVSCMEHVLPFVVLSFGTVFVCFTLSEISAKREYESVKTVLKAAQIDLRPLPRRKIANRSLWIIRGVLLVAAITFIVAGIFNGGAAEALKKAVAICKECIGIG